MFAGTLAGQAFQALIITSGEKDRILKSNIFVPTCYINNLTKRPKNGACVT